MTIVGVSCASAKCPAFCLFGTGWGILSVTGPTHVLLVHRKQSVELASLFSLQASPQEFSSDIVVLDKKLYLTKMCHTGYFGLTVFWSITVRIKLRIIKKRITFWKTHSPYWCNPSGQVLSILLATSLCYLNYPQLVPNIVFLYLSLCSVHISAAVILLPYLTPYLAVFIENVFWRKKQANACKYKQISPWPSLLGFLRLRIHVSLNDNLVLLICKWHTPCCSEETKKLAILSFGAVASSKISDMEP